MPEQPGPATVAELAAELGIELDPWQRRWLECVMAGDRRLSPAVPRQPRGPRPDRLVLDEASALEGVVVGSDVGPLRGAGVRP